MKKATFGGGCFWCMLPPFENLNGVLSVLSGYMGGSQEDATYKHVCGGKTHHREVIQIEYDENTVSYDNLLNVFWRQINPTQEDGQFADRGSQYTTAIFYHDEEQKVTANKSLKEISYNFEKPIVTDIIPATEFYPAEAEHQNYHKQHPLRYQMYKVGSGRTHFLEKKWKKN